MYLPPLVYDFHNASITDVRTGPRREVTLAVVVYAHEGREWIPVEPVLVRFGGIENYDEVKTYFADTPWERSELLHLRYAKGHRSKPTRLVFELAFERFDSPLFIRCSSLQVHGPDGQSPPATAGRLS